MTDLQSFLRINVGLAFGAVVGAGCIPDGAARQPPDARKHGSAMEQRPPRIAAKQMNLPVIDWSLDGPAGRRFGAGGDLGLRIDGLTDGGRRGDGFSDLEDEIIVIGERQRRAYVLARPSEELTGPRALDAAQPVVPWMGAACSYKTLCFDMDQPPLREVIPKLIELLD